LSARRHLKDSEVKHVIKEFIERFARSEPILKSAKKFEELTVEGESVFFVDEKPLILQRKVGLLPSLKFDEIVGSLPKIVVDMGAVPHVVNGAQVMRPGISELNDAFGKGELVAIVDEKFGKIIALGITEMDSVAMKQMSKGKAVVNVHYVGDSLWATFGVSK